MIINAGELNGMLADISRTAGQESHLPFINGILLHSEKPDVNDGDDNRLYATSTNRFLLGQAWTEATGSLAATFIDLRGIQLIRALLDRAWPQADIALQPSDDGDTLHLEVIGVGHIAVPIRDHQFPDMETVIINYREGFQSADGAVLDASLVAGLAMIGKRRAAALAFTFGAELRPTTIDIGTNYRALLMPRREPRDNEFRYSFPPRPRTWSRRTSAKTNAEPQ